MNYAHEWLFRCGLVSLGILFGTRVALADGGAIRALQNVDGIAISVFTSPAILTAGECDVSVLVQDPDTHVALTEAQVEVIVTPRSNAALSERYEAVSELAENKLLKSCHAQLGAGWHDVEVVVIHDHRRRRVGFSMQVGPAPTMAANFWPWFAWPAVPILLAGANLAYCQLQSRRSAIIKRNASGLVRETS